LKETGKGSSINNMKSFSKIFIFISAIVLCFAFARPCYAQQDISIQASVDRNEISLWDSVQLTITINGAKFDSEVKLPEIEGFKSRYVGPSSKVTIINGKYSSSTSYLYSLYPSETGEFTIPSFSIEANGETFTTKEVEIKVVEATSQASQPQGAQAQSDSTKLEDYIFLKTSIAKNEIFINEQVTVKIKLYIQESMTVGDIQMPIFDKKGFSGGEFYNTKQYVELVNGIRYDVVEFNVDAYPTRSGELSLGPFSLGCNLLVRSSRKSNSGFGSFFGDDFFDSMFDSVDRRPVEVKAEGVAIKVLPLPDDSKPVDFSGAVGDFDFELTASPVDIKVGDPITVKMKISGAGNYKTIVVPSFKDTDSFKVYEPQISEKDGGKVLEQVLIPKTEELKEIPQIKFSYFDPEKREYKEEISGPISIIVSPSEGQEDFRIFEVADEQKINIPERIGRDIIYIKDNPGKLRPIGYKWYKTNISKVFVFLIPVLFFSVFSFLLWKRRMKSDVAFARKLKAPRMAKEGISQAKKLLSEDKQRDFYEAIFKVLQEYFGNKLHLSSQGLTASELEEICRQKKVDSQVFDKLKDLLSECDQARFASQSKTSNNAKESLAACESIIDYFERKVK